MKYNINDKIRKKNKSVRVLGSAEDIKIPDSIGTIIGIYPTQTRPYYIQWDGGSMHSFEFEFDILPL